MGLAFNFFPVQDPNMEGGFAAVPVRAPSLKPLSDPTHVRTKPSKGTPIRMTVGELKADRKAGAKKVSTGSKSHPRNEKKTITKTSQAKSVNLVKRAPARKDQLGDHKTILGRL